MCRMFAKVKKGKEKKKSEKIFCWDMEMHLQGAKINVKNPFRVGDFVLGDKGKVRIKDYYFQEQDYLGGNDFFYHQLFFWMREL